MRRNLLSKQLLVHASISEWNVATLTTAKKESIESYICQSLSKVGGDIPYFLVLPIQLIYVVLRSSPDEISNTQSPGSYHVYRLHYRVILRSH